jgi:hypothetical protein
MSHEKRDINNTAELESNTAFPERFSFPYKMIPNFVYHSTVLLHDPVGTPNHTQLLGTIIHYTSKKLADQNTNLH